MHGKLNYLDFEIARQVNILKQGKKVEKEVRKANENGTTSFLRPLPGAARMYPDTDIKQILVNENLLNIIPNSLINHFLRGFFDGDGSS